MGFIPVEENAAEVEFDIPDDATVSYLAAEFRDAYDEHEIATKRVRDSKKKKDYLEIRLYDALVAAGLDGIKTEDGSFGTQLKELCAIKTGCQEDMFEYLEEIGHGDCIKRSVHYATLNKLYREGELVDAPDGLLKKWEEKKIAIRRAAGTRP